MVNVKKVAKERDHLEEMLSTARCLMEWSLTIRRDSEVPRRPFLRNNDQVDDLMGGS